MKTTFDCAIGNPPYQESANTGNMLWPQIVDNCLDRAGKGGFLAMIHPPPWRGTGKTNNAALARLRGRLRILDLEWLSIHFENDGMKNFHAATAYDMYIIRNECTEDHESEIRDGNGNEVTACVKGMEFIPNFGFGDGALDGLIANEGEERVNLIYSPSSYGTAKEWMSRERTDTHCHPCVYMISKKDGSLTLHYSGTGKRGHFGIPKVIFGKSQQPGIPFPDVDGEYGMTEFTAAVADEREVIPDIAKAMHSDGFREVMRSVKYSTENFNRHVLALFRKDFWREFI